MVRSDRSSRVAVLPASAGVLGLSVVGLSYLGAGGRPVLGTLVLALGIAAGLMPLRLGLPVAIVLACFEGTIVDFVGPPATYWNETFVALLLARAIARRRPSRVELVGTAAIVLLYTAYAATGTRLLAAGWAMQILLLSLLAAWAIARLGPGRREWHATYHGVALATGANVAVGVWQRLEGTDGLLRLGIPYGTRIRNLPEVEPLVVGELRAFGGFLSEAPFAFALVLAICLWLAFLVGNGAERRIAVRTSWLPPVAAAGIALSLNRTAVVGLCAAVLVGALHALRGRVAVALGGAAAIAVALVFAVAAPAADFLAEGFSLGSPSVDTRRVFWREYAKDLSALGSGPGSAGLAYARSTGAGQTGTPAARVYERVSRLRPGPNALAGTDPGVVDNLYLSWLFQYGVLLGSIVCWAWVVLLLRPLLLPGQTSLLTGARLWGVFLLVAAAVSSVWEEFPTDLLTAVVLGQTFSASADGNHA